MDVLLIFIIFNKLAGVLFTFVMVAYVVKSGLFIIVEFQSD